MNSKSTHSSPLLSMTVDERLVADFFMTGFTIGPHPMAYHRAKMNESGVMRAADLKDRAGWDVCSDRRSSHCAATSRDSERLHLHQQ